MKAIVAFMYLTSIKKNIERLSRNNDFIIMKQDKEVETKWSCLHEQIKVPREMLRTFFVIMNKSKYQEKC